MLLILATMLRELETKRGNCIRVLLTTALFACVGSVATPKQLKFDVAGVLPAIKQPTRNTCWATAATIMASWKKKKEITITDIVREAGPQFEFWFVSDEALSSTHKVSFLEALGLRAESPQNFTAEGWYSLLRKFGPLWVTTNEGSTQNFAIHARIMTGISGDGSADGTFVTLIDPAAGSRITETLSEFVRKMEEVAREDLGQTGEFRQQVVHY